MGKVSLRDEYVFITGAGSGIGRASAIAFAGEGARIIAADINAENLDDLRQEIEASGGCCRTEILDVTREEQFLALTERLQQDGHIPYVVFNNAGIGGARSFMTTPNEDWELYFRVNVYGMIYGIRHFVKLWRANKVSGHIVNTASAVGFLPSPFMAAYSVSKGAAYNLSEAVAGELMDEGIRVTTVCPGAINTNITMREDLTDYKPEQMQQVRKHYREQGMSPADVAAQVVDAVQTNKAAIYPLAMKMNLLRRLLTVLKLRQATVASLRSMGFVPEAAK